MVISEINITKRKWKEFQELNITKRKWKEFQEHTKADNELQLLKKTIVDGWPKSKNQVHNSIKKYNQYKQNLTIIDDLIFKDKALLVPKTLQKEMIDKIHYCHMGINKCLSLAKESLFWINMSNDIKQKVLNCEICAKYSNSQQPEPLKSHEIPTLPWNKLGCDLFQLGNVRL
ncbi:Integrase zinc binding domain [Popillia japonica]|uniref:RNA-directed DNA polymerase n=1 Tax=Popillia japonica TaxID=7064 RepID=A0AAW1KR66_POPJA